MIGTRDGRLSPLKPRWPSLAAAALIAVFAARVGSAIRSKSATFDEPYNIALGVAITRQGDYSLRKGKPVMSMALQALPQRFTGATPPEPGGAEALRCLHFFYDNAVPPERILAASRAVSLALAVLLLCLLYLAARHWYGERAALLALALATLCPNLLAHAGLATEDLAVTAGFFAAAAAWLLLLEAPGDARALAAGAASAFALMSKLSGLLLVPYAAALLVLAGGPARRRLRPRHWSLAAAALAGAFLLVYGGRLPEYGRALLEYSRAAAGGHPSYLLGRFSNHGFWHYYLVAALVKTPLPALLLAAAACRIRDRSLPWLAAGLAPLLFFAAATASPSQVGLRYVLPAYPFLYLLAGRAAAELQRPWLLGLLLAGNCAASAAAHPDTLAYFNALAGGPARGWRVLADSNADWGQDLGGLRRYVRDTGATDVVLSHYGWMTPEAVGFPFQDFFSVELWGPAPHVNSPRPGRELLAVSATQRAGVYLVPAFGYQPLAWLDDRRPETVLGRTIFVYDITRDASAHEWLAHHYWVSGRPDLARRETERALAIDGKRGWARLLSAFLAPTAEAGLERFKDAAGPDAGEQVPWARLASPRERAWYRRSLLALAREAWRRGDGRLAAQADRLAWIFQLDVDARLKDPGHNSSSGIPLPTRN